MRILLILSLLALVASAVMAPLHFKARERTIDTSALAVKDAQERAALADEQQALGTAILAYNEILENSPGDLDAIRGLFRAAVRLSAVAPRQGAVSDIIQSVAIAYLESLPEVDPDGKLLQGVLREWTELRLRNPWFIARATVATWLCSRGDQDSFDEIRSLMKMGPFHANYYGFAQRLFPNWTGLERHVKLDLKSKYEDHRLYAGVTLLLYNRIYGVGEELLKEHRDTIRDTIIRSTTNMVPNSADNASGTPGGQTILGLALLQDRDARRILVRMRALDHPYLARVLEVARFWIGLDPWEKADFDSRRYDHWFPGDIESYYQGALIAYGDLIRAARAETDPAAKADLEARAKKLSVIVENATYMKATSVKVMARRMLAAIFPEQSEAIHRELIDQGGVDSLYGAMILPLEERVPLLLPAITAGSPENQALAIVGLLDMAAPVPIQLPIRTK